MSRLARTLLLAVAALAAAAPAALADSAQVWLTSNDGKAKLARQADAPFTKDTSKASVTVDVDPATTSQEINGFGAAFTDTSLKLLSQLPADQRHAALVKLLDPHDGIGLNVMRVPMGASDFTASGAYSYDDGAADPALARFSIAHDRAYVLPVLREALKINPHLRILANPWSPPGWMKTSGSMTGPGTLRPDAYQSLAQYFVKFIEAYRAAGVPIWAVTPQNEPLQPAPDYAGMQLSPAEEALFVSTYLKPALQAAHLDGVRVYGFDYTWLSSEPYIGMLMAAGGDSFDGLAYHCYFGAPESMSALHALFPDKDVIEDECSTGISLLSPIQVLLRSVRNWASTVLMWNVALDPSGGPKMGSGCVNCVGLVTIDPAKATVSYGGGFYQLGQASSFVQRGAKLIGFSDAQQPPACGNAPVCGLEYAAFRNPAGDTVVVASNSSPAPVTFAVRRPDGTALTYSLPGQQPPDGTDNTRDASVVTFRWGGPSARAASRRPDGSSRRRSSPRP